MATKCAATVTKTESDTIIITGGRRLSGTVRLSGTANGSLPALAACLLMRGECRLENLPPVADIAVMLDILRALGLRVTMAAKDTAIIQNEGLKTDAPPAKLVKKMRGSFYVTGPLLARLGRACVSFPGGCYLGSRPVDYILDVYRALGAATDLSGDTICASTDGLRGAGIVLNPKFRSPGATFHALLGAVLAKEATIIENASQEPDVISFCHLLEKMGARVSGMGGATLRVEGVDALVGSCAHKMPSDRLEGGTFLLAGCATRGDVRVEEIAPQSLVALLDVLEKAGAQVFREENAIRVACPTGPAAVEVVTGPEPGFPTDLQPPLASVLCTARGTSRIEERIFDDRLRYADQLAKMGARITVEGRVALIEGVESLTGADLEAENIRAGASLVAAALGARGDSRMTGWRFLERKYDNFRSKLVSLGACLSSP
jgi:UDP-N-acetylglucosamine 1-carboxyvinyltransferase